MVLTNEYQRIGTSNYTVVGNNELRLYAKCNSQNVQQNASSVTIQLRTIALSGNFYSDGNSSTLNCYGNRGTQYYDIGTVNTYSEKVIGTWTFDLGHNAEGKLTGVGAGASANVYGSLNPYVEGYFDLPTIPRHFTRTPVITENSVTTTSINVGWSTSETCNRVRYKIDNGNWIEVFNGNASSGNFTISNLNANTTHSIVAECRRKDSGLTSNSNTLSLTTSNKTGHIRVNGALKDATPYVRVNGQWKVAVPHIRKNNTWERSQ